MAIPGRFGGINSIPLARFIKDMTVLQARLPELLAREDQAQAGAIAKIARARGAGLGSVHRHAAPAIKAVNQAPIIRLFGDAHPEVFGAEFGGGRRPTTRQFPPWRGSGEDAGYMLFPTIRERTAATFEERYADIIQAQAGFHG
jgi:hypothetical protein